MAAGELIQRCFAARTATHIAHLRTRSYAAHVALNEFYDAIVELADRFAETYQGQFGLITEWPSAEVPDTSVDTVKTITELRDWSIEYREACAKGNTSLENIIDEVTAQCSRSIYKLTNLK